MKISGAFLVYDEKRKRKILIQDIIHCEASVNYTTLFLQHKTLLCTRTIKIVEGLISEFGFIRIHRKYLVNSSFIDTISPENETLLLKNGKKLQISRRKQQHFTS